MSSSADGQPGVVVVARSARRRPGASGGPRRAGDLREQPVLDLVPLGGAGRVVAHGDLQPGLRGQPGELHLPGAGPGSVRAAGVGAVSSRRAPGAGGAVAAPPAAQRRRRTRRFVVVPPLPTRCSRPGRRCRTGSPCRRVEGKSWTFARSRRPWAATRRRRWRSCGSSPLLGVHRDDQLAGVQLLARPSLDVAELGVPVRVLPPSATFALPCGCSPRPSAAAPPSAPAAAAASAARQVVAAAARYFGVPRNFGHQCLSAAQPGRCRQLLRPPRVPRGSGPPAASRTPRAPCGCTPVAAATACAARPAPAPRRAAAALPLTRRRYRTAAPPAPRGLAVVVVAYHKG